MNIIRCEFETIRIFVLLTLLTALACDQQSLPELKIQQGVLHGKYLQSRKGRTYSAFTAIPYAKAPVGKLRFEPPAPAEPWDGILDASKSHPICPQIQQIFGGASILGDEDCLYLNVYTPQISKNDNLLPVMIYLHGGAFAFLSGRQEDVEPSPLLDKDVVVVVPNYRLGALGFLSTGDEVVPGNNGLKDQNLAIKWVKSNIASFGGDPERLTLFGQSAGGSSVNFHLLSPMSKGLFQGAISQSGTALSPWALAPSGVGQLNSVKLSQLLNCPSNSSVAMVDCLKKIDTHVIVYQQTKFVEWNLDPLSGFIPVVEHSADADGAFLTQHPIDIYKAGKVPDIPFMTGLTTEDGATKVPSLFRKPGLVEEFDDNFDEIAPITLLYGKTTQNKIEVSKKIRKFYFGNGPIDNSSRSGLIRMYTDGMILMGEYGIVHLHHAYVQAPVYYYLFGYRASISFCDALGDPFYDYGVCHCDDLLYLFKVGYLPKYKLTDSDERVMEVMLELWTNFAKTGYPTFNSNSLLPHWHSVLSEKLEYYSIKSETNIKMDESLYEERVAFWEKLPINSRSYHCTLNSLQSSAPNIILTYFAIFLMIFK